MAFVQIVKARGLSKEQYEKVMQIAHGGELADGELFHVAGPTADGWCVIDGWESREQCDLSMGKLMPAFQEAGVSMESMSEPEEFEIHTLRVRT
jgi:hypothetical protein